MNALLTLQTLYDRLGKARAEFSKGSRKSTSSWYGIGDVDPDAVLGRIRELFVEEYLKLPADCVVGGYKEIRFFDDWCPSLIKHLEFVRRVLPGAKFIFNIRELEATLSSGFWVGDAKAEAKITSFHEAAADAQEHFGPELAMTVRYEALRDAPHEEFSKVADFIGRTIEPETFEERLTQIVSWSPDTKRPPAPKASS